MKNNMLAPVEPEAGELTAAELRELNARFHSLNDVHWFAVNRLVSKLDMSCCLTPCFLAI